MSCLDVMYHQSYGAHYLPTAAYKATYCNHHQQQQQQRKLNVCSKMQECMEQQQQGGRGMLPRDQGLQQGPPAPPAAEPSSRSPSDLELKDCAQPAETEYLSSRCVLFTYFQGDISDVVDEHFSRALSQSSTYSCETKPIRVAQVPGSASAGLWKDGGSISEGQGGSAWNNTYPSQATSCLPSVSVSAHPDFSSSPVSFSHPEGALWAGHMLSQAGLPPGAALHDSWPYSLNHQSTTSYHNVHDVYHPHVHTRRHHPMIRPYPAHSPALDPRFSPLLLPGVRSQNQAAASTESPPPSEGVKSEMEPISNSPVPSSSVSWAPSALHGSLEVYDSALDQTKAKTSVWF
ncbi:transcription cofactor vestigial-like protein 3 [Pholidichthys leucotaenia]